MSKDHFLIGTPNHDSEKTVVILGVARGGTSMVAGTVRELGIDLGNRLGENHEDPQFLTKDVDKLLQTIQSRNESKGTWGWKMPHSIEYIAEIQQHLRNPHYIFVWRNSLSAALSQVIRTNANINNALHFATARLGEMADAIAKMDGPILLVNYDKATLDKDAFIDALASFIGVEVTPELRTNCLEFIDPDTGYKQISSSYYEAEEVDPEDHQQPLELIRIFRQIERLDAPRRLISTGKMARIIFRAEKGNTLPEEFVVSFNNHTDAPSQGKFLFDYDWEFSQNMSHKFEAKPGKNAFKIKTNGSMKRLAVLPNFQDGSSDLILFNSWEC